MNLLFGTNMDTELKIREEILSKGLATEVRPNFLLFNTLDNGRLSFETFEEYKFRQKVFKRISKKTYK